MMANEAIKLLVGMGELLSGKLFVFDALDFSTFKLNIEANPDNPISGQHPTIKELIDYEAFCGMPAVAVQGGQTLATT